MTEQRAQSRVNSIIRADVEAIVRDLGDSLKALSGKTLLVTGSAGFLCSYLVEVVATLNDLALHPPCHVIALDIWEGGVHGRLAHLAGRSEVQFVCHDVTVPVDLGPVQWIIHGASIASPTAYRSHPLETIRVNVSGTQVMLEMSRQAGLRSLVYLSSSEIYGDPQEAFVPTPEEYRGNVSCTGPRACYDESKRLAETLCMTYHRLYGTPVKIVRPFNVYGPGQRLDDGRIVPDLIRSALRREPLGLYSDGRATRAFCYVSDAVRAIWHVLLSEADGEVFNVGNDLQEISVRELAERVREVAGPPWLEIKHCVSEDAEYLTDNPQRRCPDLTKLRTQFRFKPKVPLMQGLERTLRSYREALQVDDSSRPLCV